MAINPVLGKTTQLIHVFFFLNDKILKGFDHGLVTGIILIDVQKAFDTINHDILLKKLRLLVLLMALLNGFSLIYQIVNLR